MAGQSSFYKTKIYSVHSNLRSDTFCWKTHLQNVADKKNQAAWIRIIVRVIEKCVHYLLRDQLQDRANTFCAILCHLRDRDPQIPL